MRKASLSKNKFILSQKERIKLKNKDYKYFINKMTSSFDAFQDMRSFVRDDIQKQYSKYSYVGKFSKKKDTFYILNKGSHYVVIRDHFTGDNGGTPDCCYTEYYNYEIYEVETPCLSDSEESESAENTDSE